MDSDEYKYTDARYRDSDCSGYASNSFSARLEGSDGVAPTLRRVWSKTNK
jgi:hypothetical protein